MTPILSSKLKNAIPLRYYIDFEQKFEYNLA